MLEARVSDLLKINVFSKAKSELQLVSAFKDCKYNVVEKNECPVASQ